MTQATALVIVDAHTGTLSRYEIGGSRPRLTHRATVDQRCTFTPEVVETFRTNPDPDFYVGPTEPQMWFA